MEQRITGRRIFRVFLSSPADVGPEREAVERVARRLGGIYAEHVDLQLERWESKVFEASKSFQEQIESTTEFDLVIAIFWKRIGTELSPEIFRRPDGTRFESGTVLEVESALEASAHHGRPAVFVFRSTKPVMFSKENLEDEKRQSDLLEAWWTRTFRDEAGHFLRAAEYFDATHEFEDRIEDLLVFQLQKSGVLPQGPVWDIAVQGSPYPGLRPYDSDRRAVFFGRTLAIRDALDELLPAARRKDGLPALFVIGPSGCGKSSLARAGIGPALTDPGTVPEVDLWRSATVEVDDGVLTGLAAQLYECLPELTAGPQHASAEWARLASGSPEDAAQAVSWALGRAAAAEQQRTGADRPMRAAILLLVDQLERLFGSTDEQVGRLPPALLALANTGRVWLLLTVRSDRYAELQNNPPLLELKRRGAVYDLPAPGEAEITDAVKGPARAAGLTFEADGRHDRTLPRALVDDTPGADALPLLQMTLSNLYEARAGIVMTWHAYEAMGGVSGAIASHADTVLANLSAAVRRELRRLVKALVRDVARSAQGLIRFTMVQADSSWESTPARQELATRLVAARLLVRDEPEPGRKVLRAAHEAVLRQWKPAREALEQIVDATLWRARRRVIGAGLLAVLFFALAIVAGWQANVAQNQRDKAQAEFLAAMARRAAEADTPDEIGRGGALALESIWIARKHDWPAEADAVEAARSALIHLPLAVLSHGSQVLSLAAAADGRLASGGYDGKIKVWPKENTSEPVTLVHGLPVFCLVALPDGRLASGSADGDIKLWPKDGTGEPVVLSHGSPVTSLAALADGRLASGGQKGEIKLWPKEGTGEPVVLSQGSPVTSLAALADGRLASGGQKGEIKLWPKEGTGEPVVLSHRGPGVFSLAVLADGRLVSGDVDGHIKIWPKEGSGEPVVLSPRSAVRSLAVLADGRLASGDDSGNIKIWPNEDTVDPVVLSYGGLGVPFLAVLADGRLASGGADGKIKLWPRDGAGEPVVLFHGSPVLSLAALPDGRLASGGGDGNIKLWPKDGRGEPVLLSHGSHVRVSSLALLADGKLASGGADRKIKVGNMKLWPEGARGEAAVLSVGSAVTSLALLADVQLASGGADRKIKGGNIKLWPEGGRGEAAVLSVGSPVTSLAALADGRLYSADEDGRIKLWPKEGSGEPEVLQHGSPVTSLAVLADGRLASADAEGNIKLWPKKGAGEPVVLSHGRPGVSSLAMLADGRLASGGEDGNIKLWPKEGTGEPEILSHGSPVLSLAMLADERLASGGEDGNVKLWPKEVTGETVLSPSLMRILRNIKLCPMEGADQTVLSPFLVRMLQDIKFCPMEGTVEPVVLSHGGRGVLSLAALADGRLASGGDDGTIKLWVVDEHKLIEALCLRVGRNLTREEWARYVGSDIRSKPSCRDLPSNWRT